MRLTCKKHISKCLFTVFNAVWLVFSVCLSLPLKAMFPDSFDLVWRLTKARAGVISDDNGRNSAVLPFTGVLFHSQCTTSAFIACKLLLYQNVMMLLACYSGSYNMQELIRKGSPGAWCCRLIKFHKGPLFIFIILYDTILNWAACLCFLGRKRVFSHSLFNSSLGL